MATLTWTTTDKGHAATGAAAKYTIDRTPGHRFWLCLDGVKVKSGNLADLKAAAQRNEDAAGGTDGGPKSGTGRPTGNGKPRTKQTSPSTTATTPTTDTTVVPTSAIRREHVKAVEATHPEPDAYPPRTAPTAEAAVPDYVPPEVGRPQPESPQAEYARLKAEGVVGPYVPAPRVVETTTGPVVHIPGPVAPGDVPAVMAAAAQIRQTWAAEGATREGVAREFGELLGVADQPGVVVAPVMPDADDDEPNDADRTPLAPPEPDAPDTGNPVGYNTRFNVVGTRTHRFHTRAPANVFRPFLRPPAPILDQNGRPVRSWLAR